MQYGNSLSQISRYLTVGVFKSYYVVWKLFGFFATNLKSVGLNRTMQYGNSIQMKKITMEKLFKSYYVVWKQEYLNFRVCLLLLFKSYYVVWKPMTFNPGKNEFARFKSYYVVWKPSSQKLKPKILMRLNRTMQYGNYFFRL